MRCWFAVLCVIVLSSCSTQYTTDRVKGQHDRVLYQLDKDSAFAVARGALSAVLPDSTIREIARPHRGYAAYYDKYRNDLIDFQVLVIPARGVRGDRSRVDGFYFKVLSRGTYSDGRLINKRVFQALRDALAKTGSGVSVVRLRRIKSYDINGVAEVKPVMPAPASHASSTGRPVKPAKPATPPEPVPDVAERAKHPQTAPDPPSAGEPDHVGRMEKLKEMYDRGFITRDEYMKKKAEILKQL